MKTRTKELKKVISAKEQLRRYLLRMRNQQPKTIAYNRMRMEVYWMQKNGLLKII
jgi:hypothetical protein